MKKILLIIFSCTLYLFAQEISVHKLHMQEFGSELNFPSEFDDRGRDIIPLQYDKSRSTGATIFGYLPDWEYPVSRQFLRYDILTHIGAFDFTVTASGAMTNPSGWPWTDVINTAHQNGVKVILTAVNFNGDDIHNIMTNAAAKTAFFNNCSTRMQQYQLDGVNIDFEGLNTADRGTVLNTFMMELSTFLKSSFPNCEVSFAGPALTSGYNLAGLGNACDYIFIMGYAFWGSWSSTSGACSPLTGGSINITNTVNTQYSVLTQTNPQKLILGIPYYGLKWKTQTNVPHSPTISYISSTRFKNDVTDAQTHGRLWAADQQVPWYRYQTGADWYQVWYDDDSSLGLKYSLAQSKNYRGVGMWALGYDGARQELWNELYNRFYAAVPVELTGFSSEQSGAGLIIRWGTATETNNRLFMVERKSEHETAFTVVAELPGNGTSSTPRNYMIADIPGDFGTYIYRLVQYDFDGSRNVAGELKVEYINPDVKFVLHNAYPNPFNPSATIKFSLSESTQVELVIINSLGETVQTLAKKEFSAGDYSFQFEPGLLAGGVYYYQLRTAGHIATGKIVYLK